MYSLIEGLNREGVTIIMISHDLAAALRCASHILYMGEELFFGPAADFPASAAGQRFGRGRGGGGHA